MEALKVEGLTKKFGGLMVFHDLSFSIDRGERLAVIGPNGSGKTTLFNVITGHLSPEAGRIYLGGHEVTGMPPYRRIDIGMARSFQVTRLFINLTVLDNILLALHGVRPSRFQMFRQSTAYDIVMAKAQKLMESVDLWEKRGQPVHNLSYGEQRRLEVVLSLASEPKLLLLDEPTAGLAIDEISPFIEMMQSLTKDTTIFFTAHDMDVVFGLADRIIVIYLRQIIAQGTPEEIQNNPKVREIYLGLEEDTEHARVG